MKHYSVNEPVSFYTHFFGAISAVAGLVLLVYNNADTVQKLGVVLVYGVSLIFLFSASSVYHAFKKEENGESISRKLDHLAIFFLIAGTYTPLCYRFLDGGWMYGILIAQWSLVVIGTACKLIWISAPRKYSTAVYVMMGWLIIIPIQKIWTAVPLTGFILILGGGVAYTAGAVIYAIKKPDPLPEVFGFHEIFHVCILAGAILHFLAVYLYV